MFICVSCLAASCFGDFEDRIGAYPLMEIEIRAFDIDHGLGEVEGIDVSREKSSLEL